MKELIETLRKLGFSESECAAVQEKYEQNKDLQKLEEYVLLIKLHYDDRHEYVD